MNAPSRLRPGSGRRVQLMATCLCDAIFDDVARATVQVLEHLGCEVEFPEGQTCCGQPAFNAGDWDASRQVVRHTARVFASELPIVVPSASCAAMCGHGVDLEFEKQPDRDEITHLGRKTWELTDFIVNALGVTSWTGRYTAKVAIHRSCHSRGSESSAAATTLLTSIPGVELLPFGEAEQCCGFGGTFSVSFPHVSSSMGTLKLDHVIATRPDVLASVDMSCLMHLGGLAEKQGRPVRTQHVAQILRDALNALPD